MSFSELIPAGALDKPTDVVALLRDPVNERVLTCNRCGAVILECGYVDDVEPETFRGVFCCWVDDPEEWR